jgi:hypothetical protein
VARKNKIGLSYFPHDVDLSTDEKIQVLQADYGLIGYAIYIKLLERIYRQGYFINFDDRKLKIFAMNNNIEVEKCFNILDVCLNEGLFNKTKYNKYKILTSQGIQERYFESITRRKEVKVNKKVLLIEPSENMKIINVNINEENVDINNLNVNINEENVDIKYTKESKVKESKGKEKNIKKKNTEILKDYLFEKLKINTKQEKDIKFLLERYSINDLKQAIDNAVIYWTGSNKRKYAFGKRWTRFYEQIGTFTDIEQVNLLIERESKGNSKGTQETGTKRTSRIPDHDGDFIRSEASFTRDIPRLKGLLQDSIDCMSSNEIINYIKNRIKEIKNEL